MLTSPLNRCGNTPLTRLRGPWKGFPDVFTLGSTAAKQCLIWGEASYRPTGYLRPAYARTLRFRRDLVHLSFLGFRTHGRGGTATPASASVKSDGCPSGSSIDRRRRRQDQLVDDSREEHRPTAVLRISFQTITALYRPVTIENDVRPLSRPKNVAAEWALLAFIVLPERHDHLGALWASVGTVGHQNTAE